MPSVPVARDPSAPNAFPADPAVRLAYFTPNDVLVPRVDRQCIMRFCEALAKHGVDVEVVSLDVRLEYDEPTRSRSLPDVYGLSAAFPVTILPSPGRQSRDGSISVALWRPLAYGSHAFKLLRRWGKSRPRASTDVFFFKNYAIGIALILLRRVARGSRPLLLFEAHVPPSHAVARWVVRRMDGVLPISATLQDELVRDGLAPERLLVAHQGVDLEFVERKRLDRRSARAAVGLPVDRRIAVYTGKVNTEYREIDFLVEAARLMGAETDMVIVGGRDDQLPELRSRVRAQGITNVTFTGFVAPADVFAYQMAADVLVSYYPSDISLNRYRSPGKLFEYMAARRPIVIGEIASLREVLGPESALFVEPDQPARLAAAITRVLDDPALAERLAANAYADVKSFTWDRRAERVLELVDRLAAA